jgi:hypothetical protein
VLLEICLGDTMVLVTQLEDLLEKWMATTEE